MAVLKESEVQARLEGMEGWRLTGGELRKKFKLANFVASMAFVNKIAERAEAADHHPDIVIKYNRVTVTLSTHSEGGVTEKDFALAGEIDAAAPEGAATEDASEDD